MLDYIINIMAKPQKGLSSYFNVDATNKQTRENVSEPSSQATQTRKESVANADNKSQNVNRAISVDCVTETWVPKYLASHHPKAWLTYETKGKKLTMMKCKVCSKYGNDINHLQDFTHEWING